LLCNLNHFITDRLSGRLLLLLDFYRLRLLKGLLTGRDGCMHPCILQWRR
jgi:hypothetical protein